MVVLYFLLKKCFNLVKNPLFSPGMVISTFSPKILLAISVYAFPDGALWLVTTGSPLLVCVIINSSSGTTPIKSIDNKSTISSTSIISPFLTILGLKRLMTNCGFLISDASSNPIILSASRIAEISAVVTTIARFAPAIAFLNPCSIPAGQSIKI